MFRVQCRPRSNEQENLREWELGIVGNHGCLCRLRNLVLLCYLSITKGLYVLRLHCMDLSLVSFTFFWVLLHAVAMVE